MIKLYSFFNGLAKDLWILIKISGPVAVLMLLTIAILRNFAFTGCESGSLGYGNCQFMGRDVSFGFTVFTWLTFIPVSVLIGSAIFGVVFKLVAKVIKWSA